MAGQYFDQETGLHYNYHRYYNPQTGRYITPDPIGLAGGINLYSYTENNPSNLIDPLGLTGQIPLNAIKKALGKVHKKMGGSLPKGKPGKYGSPQRGTPQKGYKLDKEGHPNSKDPNEHGPHINYWDYSMGKRGKGGVKGAEPIVWSVLGFVGSLLDPFGAEALANPEEDSDGNGIPDYLEEYQNTDALKDCQ